MSINGNVNNLVNTIAHYPAIRETINVILSAVTHGRVVSNSPATAQTDNRSQNVISPIGSKICSTDRINANLTVLPKNFQQYLDVEVARRFNNALTTVQEDLHHIAAASASSVNRN